LNYCNQISPSMNVNTIPKFIPVNTYSKKEVTDWKNTRV
jgi:hypothetical protein